MAETRSTCRWGVGVGVIILSYGDHGTGRACLSELRHAATSAAVRS